MKKRGIKIAIIVAGVVAVATVLLLLGGSRLKGTPLEYGTEKPVYADAQDFTAESESLAKTLGMRVVAENSALAMLIKDSDGLIAIRDKSTGNIFYTSPAEAAEDAGASDFYKKMMRAALNVTYYNERVQASEMDSFSKSVEEGQFEIKDTSCGADITYTIGEAESKLILPPAMSEEKFDSYMAKMEEKTAKKVKRNYLYLDKNTLGKSEYEDYLATYPGLEAHNLYILKSGTKDYLREELAGYFAEAGYTAEELSADKAENCGETASTKPWFVITVSYRIEDDSFVAEIDPTSVSYNDEGYYLTHIDLLPYFGAASTAQNGYMFVPDGSGAVININNGKKDVAYVMTYKLLPSLIEGGIAYPISDLNVIDFDDYKWRQDVVRAGEYKGKNYGMLLKDPEIRYGIFWNKTLFQKYGLPDLYELYEKDEWTWDKFKEIAIQGNIDLDGDGSYDIHGFNERESLEWCYLYSNSAEIAAKTDSGMTIDLDNPKVIEALTGLQDFTTNVDYLHGWLGDWQSQIYSFRDGQSMMCLEEYWISYSYLTKEGEAMVDDWGWVPFPKGPSATDWSCYGKEFGGRFLLNGVENPEQVLQIYNLITDIAETEDEWADLLESQLENWSVDKQTVENVSYINDKGVGNINAVKGFSGIESAMNTMFNAIKDGSKTPQTAIDENRSLILAAVADASNHDYNADMQEILDKANQTTEEK